MDCVGANSGREASPILSFLPELRRTAMFLTAVDTCATPPAFSRIPAAAALPPQWCAAIADGTVEGGVRAMPVAALILRRWPDRCPASGPKAADDRGRCRACRP